MDNAENYKILKYTVMATEVYRAPVLTGKAAHEFWERVEQSKESLSAQEVQEANRRFREFMTKQKHWNEYV
ncbi:hypothetical protein FACS189434_05620 [Bacteroidia bacterium]|nr:hypothetical protein FACS189434_05620 [Bacteroidia bacterium]